MGSEGPRRRRGVHRDGLEEAVISSSGRLTFFGSVRSQSRSHQLPPSVSRPHRHPLQSTSVARHPDPNSLTDLADFAVLLRLGTGSLAAARKGHFVEPVILVLSSLSWYKFSSPAACSSRYIISTHRFIWEVGGAATSVQARVTRELASNSLRCPRAPSSSALAARVRSIARNVVRRAALTVAALAAICSAFRRLVCRCTMHGWALCMDCAWHTFACGCALCGGWC